MRGKINMEASKSNVGYTLFQPVGFHHEFTHIDLMKQQVAGTVSYKGKVYMTVIVNIKTDIVQVEGSIDDLSDVNIDKNSYIEMFKHQAIFLIQNNISNPKQYNDEF